MHRLSGHPVQITKTERLNDSLSISAVDRAVCTVAPFCSNHMSSSAKTYTQLWKKNSSSFNICKSFTDIQLSHVPPAKIYLLRIMCGRFSALFFRLLTKCILSRTAVSSSAFNLNVIPEWKYTAKYLSRLLAILHKLFYNFLRSDFLWFLKTVYLKWQIDFLYSYFYYIENKIIIWEETILCTLPIISQIIVRNTPDSVVVKTFLIFFCANTFCVSIL